MMTEGSPCLAGLWGILVFREFKNCDVRVKLLGTLMLVLFICGIAESLYVCAEFILEEGLSIDLLARIAESMGKAAEAAGIEIVTGDTKVVEKGKGDGVFINTTGIGRVRRGIHL